jgi:hypothetical protein
MADGDETDALFRRYRRDAVLLHRPWPPHAGPQANSHFGGLPRLPESYAWPRTSRGTPLHFMAQIDCADIRFKTPLPERGVLFFFGRDYFMGTGSSVLPVSDRCRVLYAPDSSARTPPRQPPADLPHLGYPWTGMNVHPAWPVVPLPFDSFPGDNALPDASERDPRGWHRLLARFARGAKELEIGADVRDAYAAQLDARRAAALVAASGARPPRKPGRGREATEAGTAIFDFAAAGPQSFPQHWAYVHHLTRAILDLPPSYSTDEETEGERVAEAERWLGRSREGPLDRPVAEDDRQALRTWLAGLGDCPRLVFRGAVGTIWSWAGTPRRRPDGLPSELGHRFGTRVVHRRRRPVHLPDHPPRPRPPRLQQGGGQDRRSRLLILARRAGGARPLAVATTGGGARPAGRRAAAAAQPFAST